MKVEKISARSFCEKYTIPGGVYVVVVVNHKNQALEQRLEAETPGKILQEREVLRLKVGRKKYFEEFSLEKWKAI